MVTSHDTGYKALFSHPEFVEALLDGFVPHSISRLLDYRTLNNEQGHYITPLFEEKIEDVVWSVQFRPDNGGHTQTLYLYILLEFQSSVDAGMPLRMLLYSAAFYHQLLKHKKLPPGQKLPAVFPVVLYNGKARWTTAPCSACNRPAYRSWNAGPTTFWMPKRWTKCLTATELWFLSCDEGRAG